VHHIKKGRLRSIDEIRDRIRGSGVFVDRPRVVIGMARKNRMHGPTMLGIIKHNIPPEFGMLEGEITLVRDPATLRHLRIDQAAKQSAATMETPPPPAAGPEPAKKLDQSKFAPEDAVLAALKSFGSRNIRITRTGSKSLFGRRATELKGFTRAAIDATTEVLVRAGRVVVASGQLSISGVGA
jgi:hypothetical protein